MSQLNNRLQVDLFWNSTARDAVPVFYHELNNQLLRASLGSEKLGTSSVKVGNQPFPITASQKDLTDTTTSLFLALGFAFIPASYGAFVVLERETGCKHLQMISGVNFISYWLATWLWDMLNYIVPAAASVLLIMAFGIESLTKGATICWTLLAIMGYGVSCTSFTYMLSYLFESHTSAQNLLLVIYLFTGGILEIVAIVLQVIPSTKDLLKNTLIYIFRLLPNFCLADSLTNLMLASSPFASASLGCGVDGCKPYSWPILGWDLMYMYGGCLVWFIITLFLELALANPQFRAMFKLGTTAIPVQDSLPDDPDVAAECARVESGAADEEMIVLKGLCKVFPGTRIAPPKMAVQNMSFAIAEGECFGYLGMNGAGKTTTMKMLTGDELCTSGEAKLGGFDIKTQQQQVRRLIGYCPQFDALIGTLTAREHLMLFARIKGYPASRIRGYVDRMLDQLTLTGYADRQAMTFSGGTKRKLSLGIALIGNPRIVFLDEPTTGVDPESRRFMWKLISTTMQGRAVILTTHSMDECEALCSRIGIMVNGRLVCLGSAAHLKATHGPGYQFDAAFRSGANLPTAFRRLGAFMRDRFQDGVRVLEGGAAHDAPAASFSQRVKLRVPKGKMPISAIFREVELQREALELAEYSISEITLDQIFINFAKNQIDEDSGIAMNDMTSTTSQRGSRAVSNTASDVEMELGASTG
jgi:ABC-type multidrug transport system ATPase subunit